MKEEHQETQRGVSSEKEEERGPMLTFAIKDTLKKRGDARTTILEWHPNQIEGNRLGDDCY